MIRTLAEPTLTAVSGETADFLAGGEFPFLVDRPTTTPITVEFKQFGVQLAFTPVVLSPGRISLKVRTEVSEISGIDAGRIPALSTRGAPKRRSSCPPAAPSSIAGLVQENTRRAAERTSRAAEAADPRRAVLLEGLPRPSRPSW